MGKLIDINTLNKNNNYINNNMNARLIDNASKNLLPLTLENIKSINTITGTWNNNIYTFVNGSLTVTVNVNSSGYVENVVLNGTPYNTCYFHLYGFSDLENFKSDILSSGVNNDTYNTHFLILQSTQSSGLLNLGNTFYSDQNRILINSQDDNYTGAAILLLVVRSGVVCNNLTYYPMIRKAEITDSTFEPYYKTNKQLDKDLTIIESDYIPKIKLVTYSELVSLKNNNQLIPGCSYRITDYITTTVQPETQSAGNQFDVIVVADSTNTLNENASAIQHTTETTDYFYTQKLNVWKLKYDINNNTNKYAWADSTNGKGVIYEMEDEYGNKCGYDFKNIQFKFYKITGSSNAIREKCTNLFNTFSASRQVSSNANQTLMPHGFTIDSNSYEFRYTFDYFVSNIHKDYSLNDFNSHYTLCYSNEIYPLFGDYYSSASNAGKRFLNIISFRAIDSYNSMYENILKSRSFNNSFGSSCYSNNFGNECYFNSFGSNCYHNSFGNDYHYNSFGNNCCHNNFGNKCYSNSFNKNCGINNFDNNCSYNSFGNGCNSNSFGNGCNSNSFGNGCNYNSFDNGCSFNSFGNNCYHNNFGNSCYHNSLSGENSNFNSFEYVTYKTFTETIRFLKLFGPYFDISWDYGSWEEEWDETIGGDVISGFTNAYCTINDYHGDSDFIGKVKLILYSNDDNTSIETLDYNVNIPNDSHDYEIFSGESLYFDSDPVPGEIGVYAACELYDSNNNLIWSDEYSW